VNPTMRWVALVLTAAALLAGGALELALGQTPPIEGMDRLSPEERAVVQRNLERWQKMTPDERQRVLDRYREWQQLSPGQRQSARQNFKRFQALPPFRQPVGQAWIPPAGVRRLHQRTKTVVLVQNDAGFQVVEVEAFAKVRERHNRKLQSFALMNAHQLDGVLRLGERRLGLCFRVALRFDELQEAKQSLSLELVELSGQRQQSPHIRAPLLTATLREQPGFVTRFVERRFEALRERSLPRDLPPVCERFRKRVHFRPRRPGPRNYLRVGELRFEF